MKTDTKTAPRAKKIAEELTIHGHTRIDPYYWLRNREDQEVIDYLNAENAYREEQMSHLKDFEKTLFEEMKGRMKPDDESVPYRYNGYFYKVQYREGLEHPIYTRWQGTLEKPDEVKTLLDVNALAEPFDYYQVSGLAVSPNNKLLAYGEDSVSRRIYTIRFKDLETGDILEDQIPNTTGSVAWANDNHTVFYTVKDESLRPYKIFKHKLGTAASEDIEVYHETDETFLTYVYRSKSDKYIIIGSHQTVSNEFRVLPADQPDGEFRVIQPRERMLEYNIAHFGDQFYIHTNWNARNFRLMITDELQTGKEHWQEIVPHRDDVLLEGLEIFRDKLVLAERHNGITRLRVMPREGEEHYVDFGEEVYLAQFGTNREFDTPYLRIGYQSMTTPGTVYDYHMEKRELKLMKQQEVLGGFNADNYEAERLYAPARDGRKIPISLVYRKGFAKDGKQPLLLYGYGSYGHSMEPYFSSTRLSLLDRGFAFAIAHIRGGEEMGRYWYEEGKLLNKKNTFYDFIDSAEYLIREKYTDKEHLFAMGGSAGGLLMGAIINLRPDLWKGIVAAVPFVDVITTMLDTSIPLTTGEYDEWGNPNDQQFYDYILGYSPYDNVKEQDYPAMLVTTGLHDSQVQYWEPAKWVAKLREMKTDNNPLLLYTNMSTGHSGASGRFESLKDIAMDYAFLLDLAGRAK
jgi:oligopeptidase B